MFPLKAPVEMVASGGPTLSAVADDSGPESEESGGGMEERAGIVSSEEDEPDAQVAQARAERSRLVASAKAEAAALAQVVDEKRAAWVAEHGGASMELIEGLEWGYVTGLAIAGQLGSLRTAVTLAGRAGASPETQHEIMDPFSSATVGDRPGQLRSKCPGFTKKDDKCKQWCLRVGDKSIASCRNHRGQRDVETSNGGAAYVHPDCGECKTAVSGEEIDQFTGESAHTVCVRVALANMGLARKRRFFTCQSD